MVLRVTYESLPQTLEQFLGKGIVFVSPHLAGTLISAADPSKNLLIRTDTDLDADAVRHDLEAAGFTVETGHWESVETEETEPPEQLDAWIAGVAYLTGHQEPGLWMDAYPDQPSEAVVLSSMVEEFRRTGELTGMSLEDFMRKAKPTVVLLSPGKIRRFLKLHEGTSDSGH